MNHSPTPASSPVTTVVPVVSVRGSARIECPPDLAVITVTVTSRARTRESATESLVARVSEVREIIDALGAAVERSEQGAVSVWPEYRDGTERVERYVGAVSITVEVNDFSVLPDLVGRLNTSDLVQLSGPWWKLRTENPAYREARVAAAGDALNRAREYAAAFGVELVDLLEVADQGMSMESASMPMSAGGMGLMAKSMDSAAMDLDFSPQPQEVFGSLEARFSMTRARIEEGPHR